MNEYLTLGEKLILIRKQLKISATAMSKKIGCSANYYVNLENDHTKINKDTVNNLIKNLNIDINFINNDIKRNDNCYKIFKNDSYNVFDNPGERLKEIRLERKLTQTELSEKCNITQDVISCLESGNRKMSEKMALRLSESLDVGYRWLLYGLNREKYYPLNQNMINYLNEHEEIRKRIFSEMNKTDKR